MSKYDKGIVLNKNPDLSKEQLPSKKTGHEKPPANEIVERPDLFPQNSVVILDRKQGRFLTPVRIMHCRRGDEGQIIYTVERQGYKPDEPEIFTEMEVTADRLSVLEDEEAIAHSHNRGDSVRANIQFQHEWVKFPRDATIFSLLPGDKYMVEVLSEDGVKSYIDISEEDIVS